MDTPCSREEAKESVELIAERNGHVGDDILRVMAPEVREKIVKALAYKDLKIGSSVIMYGKHAFSSLLLALRVDSSDNYLIV